jgi:hypothetical protein
MSSGVETSNLKIGGKNMSTVILNDVKHPRLHFQGLGWNTLHLRLGLPFLCLD